MSVYSQFMANKASSSSFHNNCQFLHDKLPETLKDNNVTLTVVTKVILWKNYYELL